MIYSDLLKCLLKEYGYIYAKSQWSRIFQKFDFEKRPKVDLDEFIMAWVGKFDILINESLRNAFD